MTPRAALLDHEAICPSCGGERRVMRQVATALDCIAAEPKWEEVDCQTCDGCGVVVNDRRGHERDSGSPLVEAFRQVRNQLSLALFDLGVAQESARGWREKAERLERSK